MKILSLILVTAVMAFGQTVIDDFNSGKHAATVKPGAVDTDVQAGSMAGFFRLTRLGVANLAGGAVLDRPCALTTGKSPLTVECGAKATHRLEVHYGVNRQGGNAPMNLNLSANDRFRLTFDNADTALNINIEVFTGTNYATLGYNVPPTNGTSVDLDFNFADFAGGPVDFAHIDNIIVIIQTGNATGGEDYAISSLTARLGP